MSLNRKNPPESDRIKTIKLMEPTVYSLANDIPVYEINTGSQQIVKIELVFPAGRWAENFPLVAPSTCAMLKEGTQRHNALVIAGKLDHSGAFTEFVSGWDFSYISLYMLNKHIYSLLPLLKDMIANSIFPENELSIYLKNSKQEFMVDNEKVNFVAHEKFKEMIFGGSHPYGRMLKPICFDKLKRKTLLEFYEKYYNPGYSRIIVSGKIPPEFKKILNHTLGRMKNDSSLQSDDIHIKLKIKNEKQVQFIQKKNALQSAIIMGRSCINKTHEDYFGMTVLNTVLGGYFGSRLMANIREDKGYTYGIYSSLISMLNGSYFCIDTEVGAEVSKKAIDEIYFELRRLREELIPHDELSLVKNYMLGSFLRSIDGPFELAEKFKTIMTYNLDYSYYRNLLRTIKTITPAQLNELANKYLQENDIHELIVGKK